MHGPHTDLADIQGLLRSGYGNLTEASFLLLRIADRDAARRWLLSAPVTTAAENAAETVLQIAFSAAGMRALGVAEPVIAGFSAEFVAGIAGDEARSRRLGDVGANAPSRWRWGAETQPDLMVMLCAKTDLDAWRARIATEDFGQGFALIEELPTTNMEQKEPFGFRDGVSQPQLDWHGARKPGTDADLDYGNLITPGEFILGYRNEYGLYTDRPLLDPSSDGAKDLPEAADDPSRRDLGRNGSYLVFRELRQDVRGFWRFAAAQSTDQAGANRLAEAFVGRHRSGEPLVPGTHHIEGIGRGADAVKLNGYTYDEDKDGLRCPFGAHIRRANPRTGDMPGGRQGLIARLIRTLGLFNPDLREDLIAASRFHRILRRGREFGSYLPPEEATTQNAPDPQSGLHFVCLNANITRQFEFIQNAWLASSKFGGLSGESDPLIGNREPLSTGAGTDGFGLPQPNGVTRCVAGLPQFVTVAGGGYFFLPGLRALRYLAGAR
jgi:Dyp-type peroxidase family